MQLFGHVTFFHNFLWQANFWKICVCNKFILLFLFKKKCMSIHILFLMTTKCARRRRWPSKKSSIRSKDKKKETFFLRESEKGFAKTNERKISIFVAWSNSLKIPALNDITEAQCYDASLLKINFAIACFYRFQKVKVSSTCEKI